MNNLSRFTNPASGANIKTLLKELNDKGAQLRSVLWLEEKAHPQPETLQGCTCGPDDDEDCDWCSFEQDDEPEHIAPCQLELSVGNNVVLTELFADQINHILPFIKQWVIKDLEVIEKKLNNQGVYLEGQKPEPILPRAPFDNVNIMFLSKPVAKGDLVVALEDSPPIHPANGRGGAITLKKGRKARVIDIETLVETNCRIAHIMPQGDTAIYRIKDVFVQPIQE